VTGIASAELGSEAEEGPALAGGTLRFLLIFYFNEIDDVLSFNPWHCIEEHRPLGSIMHVRIKAYEMSSSFRHQMNAQPRVVPKDIHELPL